MDSYHGTTIVSVRRGPLVAIGGDGQVTLGNTVVKSSARKVRKLYRDQVLAGFAGATADAFTLFERFESKLTESRGGLQRAAVELAKDWRALTLAAVLWLLAIPSLLAYQRLHPSTVARRTSLS